VLARLHDLVIPVRALHEPDHERRGVPRGARPVEEAIEVAGRLPQIGLEHEPRRGPVAELLLVEQLEEELRRRFERVERLHVDMEVGG
jgi:hypothetical protein